MDYKDKIFKLIKEIGFTCNKSLYVTEYFYDRYRIYTSFNINNPNRFYTLYHNNSSIIFTENSLEFSEILLKTFKIELRKNKIEKLLNV